MRPGGRPPGGRKMAREIDLLILASGSTPFAASLRAQDLDKAPYLTSDLLTVGEAQELTELPRSLLIVGAGYIALELGQMFRRFGSEVTLLERGPQILAHGYEPEVVPTISRVFEKEGIRIFTRAQVHSVRAEKGGVIATVTLRRDTHQPPPH